MHEHSTCFCCFFEIMCYFIVFICFLFFLLFFFISSCFYVFYVFSYISCFKNFFFEQSLILNDSYCFNKKFKICIGFCFFLCIFLFSNEFYPI